MKKVENRITRLEEEQKKDKASIAYLLGFIKGLKKNGNII